MAVFFENSNIRCPECGGEYFYKREVFTLTEDEKNKNELKAKYFGKEMVCSHCGIAIATVDTIGVLQKI